jgi:ABC-type phosphate/phosphonate transport system substrate-binding protein
MTTDRISAMRFHPGVILVTGLLVVATGASAFAASLAADQSGLLRIGLSGAMLKEIPEATAKQALENMKALIEKQTGQKSELTAEDNSETLGQKLAQKKFDFGVFLGYEFAWAKEVHAELRPLVVATSGAPMRIHLLIRQDNPAVSLAQLKGKSLALSRESRPPARLYIERECLALGAASDKFFAQITAPATLEDEIDDVVDGVVQATAVDTLAFDAYKRRKPGRATRLKQIQESQLFPPPVIAYEPGVLDNATLSRFRDDLARTSRDPEGERLLNLWKLTGFDPVPSDYEQELAAIARRYPAPKGKKATP